MIIALATEFINLVTNEYGAITYAQKKSHKESTGKKYSGSTPKGYDMRRIFRKFICQINPEDHRVIEMQKRDRFWFVSVALPKQEEVTTGRCLSERCSPSKTSA